MLSSLNFLSEVLMAHGYAVLMIKSCKCNICKKSGERNLSQDIDIGHIKKVLLDSACSLEISNK